MTNRVFMSLVAMVSAFPVAAASPPTPLEARVDPRVELMSIVYRLAGANEYNQPKATSPYSQAVDAHFGKYRDHAAVRAAQELRAKHGISYDAPMTLALHLGDTVTFQERVAFDQHPERMTPRWPVAEARDFVKKLKDFAETTKFDGFTAQHQALYAAAGERMTQHLSGRSYVAWFDTYFGARPGAKFFVIVSLLNGPCNYGAGVRFPDGAEEITPIIGAAEFDAGGIPVFPDAIAETVVHEFCHSYTNPIVDASKGKLESAGRRMFVHCGTQMSAQAYSDWLTMMYESFVRAVVVRYIAQTDGAPAARALVDSERSRGFEWVGELADLLAKYESARAQYPTFDAFVPRIVIFFDAYAEKYVEKKEQLASRAPHVVNMTPANGAEDVDPGLTTITVVFDRPMKDQSWSVVGGGTHFMELTGQPSYDTARKIFTLPVRLKSNWSYEFWLNRPPYESFQSAEGVPLASTHVTFKTRAE